MSSYTDLAFFTIKMSQGFYGKPVTNKNMESTAILAQKSPALNTSLVTKCTHIGQ